MKIKTYNMHLEQINLKETPEEFQNELKKIDDYFEILQELFNAVNNKEITNERFYQLYQSLFNFYDIENIHSRILKDYYESELKTDITVKDILENDQNYKTKSNGYYSNNSFYKFSKICKKNETVKFQVLVAKDIQLEDKVYTSEEIIELIKNKKLLINNLPYKTYGNVTEDNLNKLFIKHKELYIPSSILQTIFQYDINLQYNIIDNTITEYYPEIFESVRGQFNNDQINELLEHFKDFYLKRLAELNEELKTTFTFHGANAENFKTIKSMLEFYKNKLLIQESIEFYIFKLINDLLKYNKNTFNKTVDEMTKDDHEIDYLIYRTKDFGTEIPVLETGKRVQRTPLFWEWYNYYFSLLDSMDIEDKIAYEASNFHLLHFKYLSWENYKKSQNQALKRNK